MSHTLISWLIGWSDASIGPLLLRIQEEYSVSYSIVSLIFISNFVGFFAAALSNVWFTDRLGLGKTLVLGALIHVSSAQLIYAEPYLEHRS
jgi:fucose permease